MTKNKKNLSWNLPELPTGGELAELVDTGVISKEEAREIMFGAAESDKEVIKTLQEQIEFLQDLVKELSKNRPTYIPTITREIHTTRPYYEKYWGNTHKLLGSTGYTVSTGTTTNLASGKMQNAVYATSGSLTNGTPTVMTMSVSSNIKDAKIS